MSPKLCLRFLPQVVALVTTLLLAAPLWGQPSPSRPGSIQGVIDTPYGKIYKITPHGKRPKTAGPMSPTFNGDTFSFEHQLGALIDGVFNCFREHMSGMDDNTVLFDGLSELLDPYLDGTQPLVFEFETPSPDGTTDNFFNSFSDSGTDLFPEGFEDPETGTPLDSACIEIGIDDTLDADMPVDVTSALIEASGDDGEIIPPIDITSIFDSPWDGRLSLVFPGNVGQGINGMVLEIQTQTLDTSSIFADGFESGDASAWTDQVP